MPGSEGDFENFGPATQMPLDIVRVLLDRTVGFN